MDEIIIQPSSFAGSKEMSLQNIPIAKASGFGAAADDYMERGIDLNEQLIHNKPATFFFRMTGDAMIDAGINNGDVLIVDRSLRAGNGKIIVASFEGELLVRRLHQPAGTVSLLSGNNRYTSIVVEEWNAYSVWGVVTYVIHSF